MQRVHLPSSAIVYETESKIVFKELRAVPFNASFNEFINVVLSSIYQRWPLNMGNAIHNK